MLERVVELCLSVNYICMILLKLWFIGVGVWLAMSVIKSIESKTSKHDDAS